MTPRAPGLAFILALASISVVPPLAIHLFLPVMPKVKSDFAIPDALAGLTFSVALFVMAFATLAYGSLSDRYGRRPVLLSGLLLFCLGSAACAFAPSIEVLIAGRILQALGAACGTTLARTIARDAYGTDGLVRIIAYLTMAYTLGPMIAPAFGGVLADAFGWRSAFGFALAAGALITVGAFRFMYETRPQDRAGQNAGTILHGYGVLLTHPRFLSFSLNSGFASGTFMAMAAASSFLMEEYLGRSATEFGLYFWFFPLGYFTGSWISSRLTQRVSLEKMVLVGSVMSTLVIGSQAALILTGHLSPLIIFIPGFLMCLAQGMALPNAQVGAIRVTPNLAGTAAGLAVFFQMFLSALFPQAYTLLADGTPEPMVLTVCVGAVLTLISGSVSFLIREKDTHP